MDEKRDTSSGSHPECRACRAEAGTQEHARPMQPACPPACHLSPPCPHYQVMDAEEQKGKQQEREKALRLRFAVKGRQPRACGQEG